MFKNISTLTTVYASEWASLQNGTWEGMAKLIDNKMADFALGVTALLPFRAKGFRYLVLSYMNSKPVYFHPLESKKYGEVYAFQTTVWVVVILLSFLIALVHYWYVISGRTLSDSVFFSVAAAAQQGHLDDSNRNLSSPNAHRILKVVVCIYSYLLYSHFGAVLVKIFSIDAKDISNFDDVLRNDFTFGVFINSFYLYSYLGGDMVNGSSIWKVMSNIGEKDKYADNKDAANAILRNEKYAVLTDVDIYKEVHGKVDEKSLCNGLANIMLPQVLDQTAGFVRKDSFLTEYLNRITIKLKTLGVAKKLKDGYDEDLLSYRPSCVTNTLFRTVGVGELQITMLVILCGGLLSVLTLLCEIMVHSMQTMVTQHTIK